MAPYRTNGRNSGKARPYLVERPSESERIGPALRSAYARDGLPDDMMACLRRLDRITSRH